MLGAQTTVRMHSVQTLSQLEDRIRAATSELIAQILTSEADNYVREAQMHLYKNNRRLVRRNGVSRQRTVQTSMGTVCVRQPRVDDRREGQKFTSAMLPPYIRRTNSVDGMIATLYLHGVSTVRMEPALRHIATLAVH